MARKAKKDPAVPPQPVPLAPVEVLKIDELSLAKMGKFSAQERAASLELATANHRFTQLYQEWLKSNPEITGMLQAIESAKQAQQKAMVGYNEILKQVSTQLKLDVTKFTYDEDTGVLTPLPM